VLYEAATGKPLFSGETATETLAAVLTKEPDLNAVPVKLRRLIRRCSIKTQEKGCAISEPGPNCSK